MKIYWANSGEIPQSITLQAFVSDLPKNMIEKSLRYKSEEAAFNYTTGRKLLRLGLKNHGLENEFNKIKINKNGKPFVAGVFFNISHSNDLVVCAFDSNEIGIDIEKIKPVDLSNFHHVFTDRELTFIEENENPTLAFYKLWVRKESFIKSIGSTIKEMRELENRLPSKTLVTNTLENKIVDFKLEENYVGAACGISSIKINSIQKIDLLKFKT